MSAEESSASASATPTNELEKHHGDDDDGNHNDNNETENHKDIDFLQAKCSLLKNQLAFLRSQQKQKKEQRKKEKGEIVSTFKSMKGYIDNLERENKQFKALLAPSAGSEEDELMVLRQRLVSMTRENQQLKQRLLATETQKQALETQCTRLETQVSQSKTTEAQLRDQVSKYEQVVDRVPPPRISEMGGANNKTMPQSNSMSVMADASDAGSRSNTIDESMFGAGAGGAPHEEDMFGKVVDLTPITPKSRSTSGNTANKSTSSLSAFSSRGEDDTVFGVADRAELASIADLDDEDDSDDDNNDDNDNDNAKGQEWAGSIAADNISFRLEVMDDKKLVDQLPPGLLKGGTSKRGGGKRTGPSSVAALPDASVTSGGARLMDDNITVGDDNDNLFGKMVDQTPDLSTPYSFKKTGSSVSFRDHLEDDTVQGVTEKLEIESVARQDDEVSSHDDDDDGVTLDDDGTRDGMSLAGASHISFKLNVKEEKNLVDHVPLRRSNKPNHHRQRDASVMAVGDNYSISSLPNDDAITDGASGGRNAFGPIVDITPSLSAAPPLSTKSMATSVATQNSLFTDLNDDYRHGGDADTLGPASTVGDTDWDRDSLSTSMKESNNKHMVDHVPKRKRMPTDLSVRVYLDTNLDNISQVDTIAEDEEMEFGPIVDQTPFSATKSVISGSSTRSMSGQVSVAGSTMAVGGGDTTQDFYDLDTVQDTFMDTGTIASIQEEGDDSTTGEEEEGEEEKVGENMVDHVPSRRKMRSVDESIRVLVGANDDMSQVDTIAEDGILDDFGPIVDHTPHMVDVVAPSGGPRSVAASTAAVVDDNRTVGDDLESMALHTTVTAEITMGMSDGESFVPLAGEEEEEKHVVDHVPSEANHPKVVGGGSVRVLVDHAETLSQVDTVAEDERVTFGPIVDHTPAFSAARSVGRSVGASMISVGTNDDSTSIQDNTTVGFGIGGSVGGGDDTGNLDDNMAPAYRPSANEDKKLVDHVPQSSFPKSEDVSVVVQADPLDAVFEVDDETGDGNFKTDRYVPIVDQTPLMRPSASPSVGASMLTTTSDAAIDLRTDDGTWVSAGETIGEVNSRDTSQPLLESLEETEDGPTEASQQFMVETVNSHDDSDDLTDDAYVRVPKADSTERLNDNDDGKQSIASDEDGGFDLKEIHNYAEELAAKASESKDNPFDIDNVVQSSPEKVKSDVQDYIASLALGTQKDLTTENRTDSVTGSVESSTHSVQEMQKYISDLSSLTTAAKGSDEDGAAKASSDPHKAETPKKKGDTSEPDARNEILDEIGTSKKQSVFGKLFRGNKKEEKESNQGGTWA